MTSADRPLTEAPNFRPVASLLGAQIADLADVLPGDLCLVGLFDDHSDSLHFGARFAARQIRYASLVEGRIFQPAGQPRVLDLGDLNVFPLERERNRDALVRQVGAIVECSAVPIIVGGAFDMGGLMQDILGRHTGGDVACIRLPALGARSMPRDHRRPIALTVDMSLWEQSLFRDERPLAKLRNEIEVLVAPCIRAVYLTGIAPELDLCGRHESSLGDHVLRLIVAHLRRVGG